MDPIFLKLMNLTYYRNYILWGQFYVHQKCTKIIMSFPGEAATKFPCDAFCTPGAELSQRLVRSSLFLAYLYCTLSPWQLGSSKVFILQVKPTDFAENVPFPDKSRC